MECNANNLYELLANFPLPHIHRHTYIWPKTYCIDTHTHIISLVTYLQHINIIEFSIFLIDIPCCIDIVSASCTCIYVCNLFIYNFYYIYALSVFLLSMSVMSISIINCTCILYPHPCFTKYIFGWDMHIYLCPCA